MAANNKRMLLWAVIAAIVLLGLLGSLRPQSLTVDLLTVSRGDMLLTVSDEGQTRVEDVFVVSSPINGVLRRIEAEPGDAVAANETLIAEVEASDADPLDPRSQAEAQAELNAAESAESLARSELERVEAELQFASSELDRTRELVAKGTVSERDLEASERAYKTSQAAVGVAQAALQVRSYELGRARARLMSPGEMASRKPGCECLQIRAPVDGQVLRVLRESEGFVRAGEGIIEIGNPERLEIVVDLLSTDAVKVQAGQRALIENWGGNGVLSARVRLVEPFGYTKISALGIEEQRVNVVLDISSPESEWAQLGHGYQVDVRVVLWEGTDVLKAPLTALFRDGEEWALFVNDDGRAQKRRVELGYRNADEGQILSGLSAGESIVVYPGEGIEDGTRLAAR